MMPALKILLFLFTISTLHKHLFCSRILKHISPAMHSNSVGLGQVTASNNTKCVYQDDAYDYDDDDDDDHRLAFVQSKNKKSII